MAAIVRLTRTKRKIIKAQTTVVDLIPRLIPVLKKRIKAYHNMFSLPLIAEHWEELLHRSFGDIGYSTTWIPSRSHKIGEDMSLPSIPNSRISCKSGAISNCRALRESCVNFNGSRSESHPTLAEKIKHFSTSHDDYYFLLSKKKASKKKPFDFTYNLLVFPSSLCRIDQLDWEETVTRKQWKSSFRPNGPKFCAPISKSMSAQLWTTLPLRLITHQHDIVCK